MFGFESAGWLAALVVVPLIWWLHQRGLTVRAIPVAGLFIWPAAQAAGPESGSRTDPRWRRRALACLCLVLALAAPWLGQGSRPVAVWLDTSVSMLTLEGDQDRLADALLQLTDLLGGRRAETLALSSEHSWPGVPSHEDARDAVQRQPVQPPVWLDPGRPHWLVTDAADPAALEFARSGGFERVLLVGKHGDNVGVRAVAVRRGAGLDQPVSHTDVLVEIQNGDQAAAAHRTIILLADGEEVARRQLAVGAGGTVHAGFEIAPGATTLEARLNPADRLTMDDSAVLSLEPLQPLRVAIGGNCPATLHDALSLHPGVLPDQDQAALSIACGNGTQAGAKVRLLDAAEGEMRSGTLHWRGGFGADRPWTLEGHRVLAAGGNTPAGDVLLSLDDGTPLIVNHQGLIEARFELFTSKRARPGELALLSALLDLAAGRELLDPVASVRFADDARVDPGLSAAPGAQPAARYPEERNRVGNWLLCAAALIVLWDLARERERRLPRTMGSLAVLALLAFAWLTPVARPLLLLHDVSASHEGRLPAAAAALGADAERITFGDESSTAAGHSSGATDIESALRRAAVSPDAEILLFTDGRETTGDAGALLSALRRAGRVVYVAAPYGAVDAAGRAEPGLDAPASVAVGEVFPVHVADGRGGGSGSDLVARGGLDPAAGIVQRDGAGFLAVATEAGPLLLRVPTTDGRIVTTAVHARADATALYVTGPSQAGPSQAGPSQAGPSQAEPIQSVLKQAGWNVSLVTPAQLAAGVPNGTALVVLDNVAVSDAPVQAWDRLVHAVRRRGTGLLVLGGANSYGAGGYRHSALEDLLPVISEPGENQPAGTVLFVLDVSGSMDRGAAGDGVRLDAAFRALLETLPGLGRDRVGFVTFDAGARQVMPFVAGADAYKRVLKLWPQVQPHGATRLAAGLDVAFEALASAPAGPRVMVLISDGFADHVDTGWGQRLREAGIESHVFAIGDDADLDVLGSLVAGDGQLVTVTEPGSLPLVLPRAIHQARAPRSERVIPRVVRPLAFLPAGAVLPGFGSYAVTTAKPAADVYVETPAGEPLLAAASGSMGRVVAVTAELQSALSVPGSGDTLDRLAHWVAGMGTGGVELQAEIRARTLALTVDVQQPTPAGVLVTIARADGVQTWSTRPIAPRRYALEVPTTGGGMFDMVADSPTGRAGASVYLPQVDEFSASSGLHKWLASGLVKPWSGGEGSGYEWSGHEGSGHEGSGHEGSGHEGSGHEGSSHEGSGQGWLGQDVNQPTRASILLCALVIFIATFLPARGLAMRSLFLPAAAKVWPGVRKHLGGPAEPRRKL